MDDQQHRNSAGVRFVRVNEEQLTPVQPHPLESFQDSNMLMQFFNSSFHNYMKLANQKLNDGDDRAAKYYLGMADGIRLAFNSINEFRSQRIYDPQT